MGSHVAILLSWPLRTSGGSGQPRGHDVAVQLGRVIYGTRTTISRRNSCHLHRCHFSTFSPPRHEKACFQHAAAHPSRSHGRDGSSKPPELCPFSSGTDKARAEQQVKGGTLHPHQGCREGVGAERDKRNGRAQSNPPLPGDSAKTPIDGISSITKREGLNGPAPEEDPSNSGDRTAPSPPTR